MIKEDPTDTFKVRIYNSRPDFQEALNGAWDTAGFREFEVMQTREYAHNTSEYYLVLFRYSNNYTEELNLSWGVSINWSRFWSLMTWSF
jgi:hypothetical protein